MEYQGNTEVEIGEVRNSIEGKKRVQQKVRVNLTERDIEILVFLMEMKFSSLDELYFKFFKRTKDGSESKSSWWARNRINSLRESGLIKVVYFYTEAKSYFVATYKAQKAVERHSAKQSCKPLLNLDLRTFEHDKLVLHMRLHLESLGLANSWQSERLLSESLNIKASLGRDFRPDGIYLNSLSKKVAFELEISTKAKKRYQDKIKRYVSIMRGQNLAGHIFDITHFVCTKESVFEILKHETKIYSDLFRVEILSDYHLTSIQKAASHKTEQLSMFLGAG